MKNIKKFNDWVLNELQSAEAPIKSDGGEPYNYNYGNIKDILGNRYNFVLKNDKPLKEFEDNVLSKIKEPEKKNDNYFVKQFVEFNRNKWKLTPPFEDDLIMNNDFFAKSFYDDQNRENDEHRNENKINEDGVGCATLGNTGGMGAVVSSQPSIIPGNASGATTGSGDIGSGWNASISNNTKYQRKKKKHKRSRNKKYANQYDGDEYKQGGDKDASVMKFSEFSQK
jgi:hypothetical protein